MGLSAGRLASGRGGAAAAWAGLTVAALTGAGLGLLHGGWRIADAAGIPLLAVMFVVIARHARRKRAADRERQLLDEQNTRLLAAQRRFLQDAPDQLRDPLAITLARAELLAKDLSGRELDDIETVADQMIRLRRLSEQLLVIAAAEDPPSGSVRQPGGDGVVA
jgi:signal transduction histidine kinase